MALGRVSNTAALRGDFDGDGQVELLNYDGESGLVSIVDSFDGSSTPRPLSFAPPGAQPYASGDFYRAGRRELLWRDSDTDTLTLWTLDGSVLPRVNAVRNVAGDSLHASAAWQLAGVGDFDADGASDLLWREAGGNRTVLWLMNGETRTASPQLPRINARMQIAAVNDFDGDGASDIVWFDPSKRTVRVWLMNGARLQSDLALGVAPRAASILASGDYDGNGSADLLWQDDQHALTLWQLRNARLHQSIKVGDFTQDATVLP